MSVRAEGVRAAGAATDRGARPRRALAAVQRAWAWLVEERVDESSAQQRRFIARVLLLSPQHWR